VHARPARAALSSIATVTTVRMSEVKVLGLYSTEMGCNLKDHE